MCGDLPLEESGLDLFYVVRVDLVVPSHVTRTEIRTLNLSVFHTCAFSVLLSGIVKSTLRPEPCHYSDIDIHTVGSSGSQLHAPADPVCQE